MKKIIILSLCFMLSDFCAPAFAQETLSLQECREMALKYNKEMAASIKQTESTHYTAKSYKGNFFPNFTASGTGLYSNADGSYGIAGGNLPTFLPDATGQLIPNGGFAYFPGINLDYKIGWSIWEGYSWNSRFIWVARSLLPTRCRYWENRWRR